MIRVDVEQFDREGFVLVRSLLDSRVDLDPMKQEYGDLLDRLTANWRKNAKISSEYRHLNFSERVCALISEGVDCSSYFDISLPSNAQSDTPIHLGPAVFGLLRNSHILDVLEQLIGGEIYASPVQHIRIKPPEMSVPQSLMNGLNAAVGWHQDMGVVNPEADDTRMISVWIAILDATVENGCLQVVPGSHRGELALHCNYAEGKRKYFQISIPDALIPTNQCPIPMKAGDALSFTRN